MKAVGKILSRHLKDISALIVNLFESLTLKGSNIFISIIIILEHLPIFQSFFTCRKTEKVAFEWKLWQQIPAVMEHASSQNEGGVFVCLL